MIKVSTIQRTKIILKSMNLQNTPGAGTTDKLKISRTLYMFAWFIEICAVLTGLAITYLVGVSTYEQNVRIDQSGGTTNFSNVLIAALPFFMVSVVELAKIPAAQAMYWTTARVWKTIFALVLIFLAFITFETAINGFERNFHNLNYQINSLMTKKGELIERKANLESQVAKSKSVTREDVIQNFEQQLAPIRERRDTQLAALADRGKEINAAANSEQIKALRDKLADVREQREKLLQRRDQEISNLQGNASRSRENARQDALEQKRVLETQAQQLEANLRNKEDAFQQALASSNFFTKSSVKTQFEPEIADLKSQISTLRARILNFNVSNVVAANVTNTSEQSIELEARYAPKLTEFDKKIESAAAELAKAAGVTQKDLDRDRSTLQEERAQIVKEFDSDFSELQSKKNEELKNVATKEIAIEKLLLQVTSIEGEISDVKEKINSKAPENQVYRLAMMFDSNAKTVADIDPDIVNLVGKFWFGSLAMVIAVTGIVLALASEVMKDDRRTGAKLSGGNRGFGRNLRSLSLALTRLNRKKPRVITEIREVIKEVPVDRVVIQDKIQQVIKKEVIHVPIYTNDPTLLRRQDVPS